MKNKNYEPRYIKNSINNIEFSIFDDETKKTLSDLLSENDKNAGILNSGIFNEQAENQNSDVIGINIFFNIYSP